MEGYTTRKDRRSLVFIWGSCNGLVLMTFNTTDIYLFNFATRKSKKNESFQPKGEPGRLSDHFVYGLGYDESADEYKVVCIYSILDSKPYQTQIYSSKTLSWKKIEDFDKGFPVEDSGKFVNGKLHLRAAQDGGDDHDIVSLDLVEEKYGVVAQPENFSTPIHYKPMLGDLGGYLSLVSYAPMLDTNVWVMMEYGVRESWTKIWSLSDFDVPKNHYRGAMPILFKKNGDITVALGSSIVVCNGRNKMHASRSAVIDDISDAIVYVGSLVSPFGDVENHLYRMGPEL